MLLTIDQETARNRANIYKILSVLYNQPDDEIEQLLAYLQESLQAYHPQLVTLVEEMMEEYLAFNGDITPLKVDNAKLFIGPFDVLAPPYGCIYLDGERKLMGDSTMAAVELYKEAGLIIDEGFKDAPDHITAELEFIYYLIARYLNADDKKYIELQHLFIKDHLGRWVEPFTARILQRAETHFYKNLGLITKKFIDLEFESI